MKKFLLAAILVAVAVSVLPARGNPQGGENYLRFAWWGNTVRDERTMNVIRLFMDRNPGVTVEPEPVGWASYWDVISTQAAAGSLPDVMQQDVSYLLQFANSSLLADLSPFVQRRIIDLANWDEAGLGAGRINNRLVGLILGTNAMGMGTDPAVLQRAGVTISDESWTWADYERIAMQVFRQTGVRTGAAFQIRVITENISLQFGTQLFTPDGQSLGLSVNQQAFNALRDYLAMELRLMQAGALIDPEDAFVAGRAMEEEPLNRGNAWNNTFWSNQLIGHQNAAGRPLGFSMFPTVEGMRPPFGTFLRASMYISMLQSSKNQDLAARFIEFFVNDIEANRILLAERGVPIPTHVRSDLYSRVDPLQMSVFDYITRITPFASPGSNYPPRAGEAEDAMRRVTLEILTGRTALDAGMNQMVSEVNAILRRP